MKQHILFTLLICSSVLHCMEKEKGGCHPHPSPFRQDPFFKLWNPKYTPTVIDQKAEIEQFIKQFNNLSEPEREERALKPLTNPENGHLYTFVLGLSGSEQNGIINQLNLPTIDEK